MPRLDILLLKRIYHIRWADAAAGPEQHGAQPAVGSGALRQRRHRHGQILKFSRIPRIYLTLFCDPLCQHLHLSAAYAGAYVRQAVVIADLLMLIPRERLAGLGRKLERVLCRFLAPAQQHTSAGGGYYLIAVE